MGALNQRMAATMTPGDPAVSSVAISGSAQALAISGRAILVSTAGTVTGQLLEDTADVAYILPVGVWPLAFKSITSVVSLVGRILL